MKSLKLFVSVATVCLLVAASGTAMAQDLVPSNNVQPEIPMAQDPVLSNNVQPDIPGLVAEVVAQGLAAEGYEVKADRDGNSVMIATHLGELILDLPATLEALERGEITVSLDGKELWPGDADLLQDFGGDEPLDLFRGPGSNPIRCIFTSLEIFILSLGNCSFQGGQCVIEAYFDLVLDILRCL